jgi:probable rRNA maturation factor
MVPPAPNTMMSAPIQVDVQFASTCAQLPAGADICRWAAAALDASGAHGDVCIRIVDDDESAELNGHFRDKPTPTNVLSFPADAVDPDGGIPLLGDIVICAPLVAREAMAQMKRLEHHWAHLVVHGVLHLLGYDHETDADAEYMESREIEILEQLGIADPYAA